MESSSTAAPEHHALGSEFEHEPVPASHRRSVGSVSAVWFGFPMILTNAIFGGVIVYGLGFWRGLAAILAGNLVLLVYVGALSYVAGKTGKNFALIAAETFGRSGRLIPAAFLSTVVIGWFAFQTGLTGATLNAALGWNETAMIALSGVLYIAVTFIGIRALTVIGLVAVPLFVVLGGIAVGLATAQGGVSGITSYAGGGAGAKVLSIGAAMTVVIASFADSGTMTADFTRWSRTGREAVVATLSAFPVANTVALVVGGIIVAAGGAINPAVNGGDFLSIITSHGSVLTAVAVLFVFVNLGSVCTHCLYNGAVGWSQLTGSSMRLLTVILGVIGLIAALAGVWSHFAVWLNVLGIFVPPIGAVIIVDQFWRKSQARALSTLRMQPFLAWIIGSAGAYAVHVWAPQLSEAIAGMIIGALAYVILEAAMSRSVPQPVAQPTS